MSESDQSSSRPRVFAEAAALAIAVVLALAVSSSTALAQAKNEGTIQGIVIDANTNKPVKGATVRAGKTGPAILTDQGGVFKLKVKAGTYEVIASQKGYKSDTVSGVEVKANGVTDVACVLTPG